MDTFIVTHLKSGDTLYLDMSYNRNHINFCTRNNHISFDNKILIDFRDGKYAFFDGRYCINCGRVYVDRNYYAGKINNQETHDINIDCVLQDGSLLSDTYETNASSHSAYKHFPERAEQSILNKHGYNVGQTDDLPDWKRQEILKDIIDSGELSQGYICSHLKYLIKINGQKKANWLAVQKWKRDLEFVQNIKRIPTLTLEDFMNMSEDDQTDDNLPF